MFLFCTTSLWLRIVRNQERICAAERTATEFAVTEVLRNSISLRGKICWEMEYAAGLVRRVVIKRTNSVGYQVVLRNIVARNLVARHCEIDSCSIPRRLLGSPLEQVVKQIWHIDLLVIPASEGRSVSVRHGRLLAFSSHACELLDRIPNIFGRPPTPDFNRVRAREHEGHWWRFLPKAPPPRPTSIGTAGRLQSEQVADINRNARPASSESATYCAPGFKSQQVIPLSDQISRGWLQAD